MITVTVAGPKGGGGKTTIATALAVRASQESGRVALLDLNEDQGTAVDWWVLRGRPASPFLHEQEGTLDAVVNQLEAEGWTHCFIDAPPYEQDLIEMSVIVGTAVIIPIKLAYFDTSAIDSIVGMCRRRGKPYLFVPNEYDDRAAWANANKIGLRALEGRVGHDGRGRIAKPISASPKHRIGQVEGKTGAELDTRGKKLGPVAREIESLWVEVMELASGQPALKVVEGGRG